jgi:hypothetical protein
VAAYLTELDLTDWDPKAPPPLTRAFWEIVSANRAPEDAEFADCLDALGKPPAVVLPQLVGEAARRWPKFRAFLEERRNARAIPYRLESVGYVSVRNETDKRDGLWKVGNKRCVIYARKELLLRDRHAAATALVTAHQNTRWEDPEVPL